MFKSADEALRWSAQVKSAGIFKLSSINKLCCKRDRGTTNQLLSGLSQEDRHLQANNIYSAVINLDDEISSQYLQFKYYRVGDITWLNSRVCEHIETNEDFKLIILAYLGVRSATARLVKRDLKCGFSKATTFRKKVYEAMDAIHHAAIDQIEQKLKEKEIVDV